jgi:hypothetical protein
MHLTIAWSLLAAALAAAEPTGGAPSLFDVAGERQLFIDDAFFAQASGVRLRLHPAQKAGEKVLWPQWPWESATLNWFSVLEDPGVIDRQARYRMWYECYDVAGWDTGDDTSFCYAESRDGVHWSKPALGLFEYDGNRQNNILFRQIGQGSGRSRVHGTGVFRDPTAPPTARYKAVSQGIWRNRTPPHRIAGMFSPDGLRWTRYAEPICDMFADSQYSAFWDPRLKKYVLYGRAGGVGRAESSDFCHFPPLRPLLSTNEHDPPDSNLYNPAALRYAGAANVYLMFPSLYQHRPETVDIRLAASRDGVHWTRSQQDAALVPLGLAGAADGKTLYLGQGLIRADDEMWLYYSGSPLRHNEAKLENLKGLSPRTFRRLVFRRDRLVSADAGRDGGYFVTPPLCFTGAVLKLNLQTRPGGSVRVGLLDETGRAIPGRGVADCLPLMGDQLDAVVRWNRGADVSERAGRPTRMRVEMIDVSVYGFQFARSCDRK